MIWTGIFTFNRKHNCCRTSCKISHDFQFKKYFTQCRKYVLSSNNIFTCLNLNLKCIWTTKKCPLTNSKILIKKKKKLSWMVLSRGNLLSQVFLSPGTAGALILIGKLTHFAAPRMLVVLLNAVSQRASCCGPYPLGSLVLGVLDLANGRHWREIEG